VSVARNLNLVSGDQPQPSNSSFDGNILQNHESSERPSWRGLLVSTDIL
jgi:hypothetical protein